MAPSSRSESCSLTTRLFPAGAQISQRLEYVEQGLAGARRRACGLLRQCNGWEPVLQVLRRAATERRPTLVYGDYDADGVISTLLLQRWLREMSIPGNVFLPNRFRHGYGLQEAAVRQAVAHGYQTLLVLDCGTANIDEVQIAREAGIDTAIIDHHEPKDRLPAAPLLNPHLEPMLPPSCTAGLVFQVLSALYEEGMGQPSPDESELAGIATLADVVPLVPDNWLLAHEALLTLPESPNFGLAELIKVSGLHGLTRLTAQQLNFQIIPRLNAPGRMRSPKLAYDLLASSDRDMAALAARQIDALNQERKLAVDQATRQALLQALEDPQAAGLALYAEEWSLGIIGVVAARVAEQLGKPTVVFTDSPQADGLLSGSARSAGGLDIVQGFAACGDSLVSYGGHAQAAGIKIRQGQLAEFRQAWAEAVAEMAPALSTACNTEPVLPAVQLHELTTQFEDDIWRLAPFGQGYTAPRCKLAGVSVARVSYMGRDKLHANLVITDGVRETRVAGFQMSHIVDQLRPGQVLNPVVEIEPDNWNNRLTLMLRLIETGI